jgi:hypothetical protein
VGVWLMVRFLILRLEVERRGEVLGSLRRGVIRGLRTVCMEVQAQEAGVLSLREICSVVDARYAVILKYQ